MNINPSGFLWLQEHKLVPFLIKEQVAAIAWDPSEHINFRKDYFEPIVIPTSHGSNEIFPYHPGYMTVSSE